MDFLPTLALIVLGKVPGILAFFDLILLKFTRGQVNAKR